MPERAEVPRELLEEARLLAVERGTSLSGLLAEYLGRAVLAGLRRGFDLGTKGSRLPSG